MTIHSSGSVWTPSTRQVAQELDARFPRRDWTSTYPGHGEIYPKIPGYNGNDGRLAIDLMVSDRALGQRIADYAWANRKRLGIRYVIFWGRIISETSSTPSVWVRYFAADDPNPSKSHHNHVHISRYSNKGYTGSVPAAPVTWDGKSFPGSSAFYVGAEGLWVTFLGQRLVAHGWDGYADGPGPRFTETDKAGVKWFQEKQGWTGSDADGIPGKQSWDLLVAAPAVVKPPVVVPPVVVPPVVTTPTPVETKPKGILKPVRFLSLNAQWPEFGSTIAKVKAGTVKPWSVRKGLLAKAIKANGATVVAVQELGQAQAAELAKELGQDWGYDRLTLNCVFWNKRAWTYNKSRELVLNAYGQYPGRSYIEVWLKDEDGNDLRAGSTHLTVKSDNDAAAQLAQIKAIINFADDSTLPLVIGIDTNNKEKAGTSIWTSLVPAHYTWDRGGIDALLWNYGVKIDRTDSVELGAASDHNGRTALLTTEV